VTTPDIPQFTVDTGLFRQLGELLVGRDSTALIELVKNAYDADATLVVLKGENLRNLDEPAIQVVDNGTGMTATQFRSGFLRLAARSKVGGDRRSIVFGRRFTGEKGVGRLAAHKLGALLEIVSIAPEVGAGAVIRPDGEDPFGQLTVKGYQRALSEAPKSVLVSSIDWDRIEESETISAETGGVAMDLNVDRGLTKTGTTLVVSRLRHIWTDSDLADLSRQLRNFEPPKALASPIPRTVLKTPLLLGVPKVRDSGSGDPGMRIEVQGDFASAEEYWKSVEDSADWILEIHAGPRQDVQFSMAPTNSGLRGNPHAIPFDASMPHPAPMVGPYFDARIYVRSGAVPTLERAWSRLNSGVRVYLEGFRVLPYGEVGNDWLSIDQDYTRRAGRVEVNPLLSGREDTLAELKSLKSRDVNLRLQPNRNFFGAVFLTDAGSGGLRTLVNREGFVPDESYERLVAMVRTGVNLLHRSWGLAGLRQKEADAAVQEEKSKNAAEVAARELAKRLAGDSAIAAGDHDDIEDEAADAAAAVPGAQDKGDEDSGDPPGESGSDESDQDWSQGDRDEGPTSGSGARMLRALEQIRVALKASDEGRADPELLDVALRSASASLDDADAAASALLRDSSLMRVLASVGSQLATVTHEIGHLVPIAMSAESDLRGRDGERWPPRTAEVRRTVVDLRRAIERQASYLVDVSVSEARRRRTRLNLSERVDISVVSFSSSAASRSIELDNRVQREVKTPPMFASELQAMLSNLVSNAIKAANEGGEVAIRSETLSDHLRIVVENTGKAVDLAESEYLFEPYVSTSVASDPVLGQGMGLGLAITRGLVEQYGGNVHFIEPGDGFDTAAAIDLPRR